MKLLMTGKRRSGNWTGNYLITVDHDNLKTKSPGYIGKLRSNFWGSTYNLYDSGENPSTYPGTAKPRENMAGIEYVSRILTHFAGISLVRTQRTAEASGAGTKDKRK